MLVCCCSNPSCMVNGCQQAGQLRREYSNPPQTIEFKWPPSPVITPPQITEEDIRRIIREELARGAK